MKNSIELQHDVQEALTQNQSLKEKISDLRVSVNNGYVIITGTAGNVKLRQQVDQVVRNIPGITFRNDIKIASPITQRVAVQIDWINGKIGLTQ